MSITPFQQLCYRPAMKLSHKIHSQSVQQYWSKECERVHDNHDNSNDYNLHKMIAVVIIYDLINVDKNQKCLSLDRNALLLFKSN